MNGLVNVPFWDFEHFKNPSGDHISYIQSGDQDIVTCTNRYWREYCDSDDTQSISSGLNPKYENLSVQKKFVYKLPNFCTRMDQSGSLEEIGPKQFCQRHPRHPPGTLLLRHGARWCRWFPRRWPRVDRIWAPKSAGLGWLRSHGVPMVVPSGGCHLGGILPWGFCQRFRGDVWKQHWAVADFFQGLRWSQAQWIWG